MVLLLVTIGKPKAPAAPPPPDVRLLTATGEGEVRVKPDVAYLILHVRSQGASASEAEALHAASVAHFTSVGVAALGLKEEDLRAPGPTLRPVVSENWNGERRLLGYEAVSELLVTIRGIGQVDDVIARLLLEGAAEIDPVLYGLADPERMMQAAIQQALVNAHERAAAVAQVSQVKITGMRSATVLPAEPPHRLDLPGPLSLTPSGVTVRVQVEATYEAQ